MGFLITRTARNVWPNGKVPFVINDGDFPPNSSVRREVDQAIQYWNNSDLGVRMVPRNGETDYVEFVSANESCFTNVGLVGGRQTINCDLELEGFNSGSAVHEMGHMIGLFHEQTRSDATDHVTVHYENIRPGLEHNFFPHKGLITSETFDFASIMMYSSKAFSTNGHFTITTKDGNSYNTNYSDFTQLDRNAINCRYPREEPAGPNTVQASMVNHTGSMGHDNCVEIVFDKAMSPPPAIVYSLQGFDTSTTIDPRLAINQNSITTSSLSSAIRLQSWHDTKHFNMWAGWLPIQTSPTLQTGVWKTSNVQSGRHFDGDETIGRVNFPTAFGSTPRVVVMLSGFNTRKDLNIRIEVEASGISKEGFTISARRWFDTVLYSAEVTWLATTEDSDKIAMGYWDSKSVPQWNAPQELTSGEVEFPHEFPSTPSVLTGYARIDTKYGEGAFRGHCIPSDITQSGFTVNLATWEDSIAYSGKIAYVAVVV